MFLSVCLVWARERSIPLPLKKTRKARDRNDWVKFVRGQEHFSQPIPRNRRQKAVEVNGDWGGRPLQDVSATGARPTPDPPPEVDAKVRCESFLDIFEFGERANLCRGRKPNLSCGRKMNQIGDRWKADGGSR